VQEPVEEVQSFITAFLAAEDGVEET